MMDDIQDVKDKTQDVKDLIIRLTRQNEQQTERIAELTARLEPQRERYSQSQLKGQRAAMLQIEAERQQQTAPAPTPEPPSLEDLHAQHDALVHRIRQLQGSVNLADNAERLRLLKEIERLPAVPGYNEFGERVKPPVERVPIAPVPAQSGYQGFVESMSRIQEGWQK